MKNRISLTVVVLGFLLVLAACGGAGTVSNTINVTMTDFQFSPNTFTVPAGQTVTLNAANNGAVIHNFVIMKLGQSAGASFGDEDLPNVYWQVEVQPGASANATFTAPAEPGSYEVVCGTPGHLEAGMSAKLIVEK
ncbi:MAG: cupredoxin domain-containing protein [Chloroflexi bacterium]|nr:cupredoxin domain-containing protein [Chloroflexota bacterium]